MGISAELRAALDQPDTQFVCLEATGRSTVDPPDELAPWHDRILGSGTPLDLFDDRDRHRAIALFGLAHRHGHAAADLDLADGVRHHVQAWNATDGLGCFVITAAPHTIERRVASVDRTALPARSASFTMTDAGEILTADPEMGEMLGIDAATLIGGSSLDVIHEGDHEDAILAWVDLLERGQGATSRQRQRFLHADGRILWMESTDHNDLDETGTVRSTLVDISHEMAVQLESARREALLAKLAEALPSGVLHLDESGAPEFWNERWVELLGVGTADLVDVGARLVHPEPWQEALAEATEQRVDVDLEVEFRPPATIRFASLHLRPVPPGPEAGILVTVDDITDAHTYRQRLLDQANRDDLTGLLSRRGIQRIVEALVLDRPDGERRSLLFVDLDRFKPINDHWGHAVGDAVLRAVGDAITSAVRPGDAVGRIGGDEFLVVLDSVDTAERVEQVARRVREAIPVVATRFWQEITIGASVGIADVEPDDDFDSLIRRADAAMYAEKARHRADAAAVNRR